MIVTLLTNERTPLPEEMLFTVIRQFRGCACFFIELEITGEDIKNITAEVQHITSKTNYYHYFIFLCIFLLAIDKLFTIAKKSWIHFHRKWSIGLFKS